MTEKKERNMNMIATIVVFGCLIVGLVAGFVLGLATAGIIKLF